MLRDPAEMREPPDDGERGDPEPGACEHCGGDGPNLHTAACLKDQADERRADAELEERKIRRAFRHEEEV